MKNNRVANLIRKVLSGFENKSIRYAILRNYDDSLIDGLKDLDILINPRDLKKASEIIKEEAASLVRLLYKRSNQQRMTFSFLFDDGTVFFIDLNKYVTLKRTTFQLRAKGLGKMVILSDLMTKTCYSRFLDLSLKILCKEQEYILLINHLLTKKKLEYLTKINQWLIKNECPILEDLNDKMNILHYVNYFYLKSDIKKKKIVPGRLILKLKAFLSGKYDSFKNAKIICFSGPDESGKSTTYLETARLFKILKVKYYPLKSSQIVFQFVRFLIKRKRRDKEGFENRVFSNVGRLGYSDAKRDRDTGKWTWKLRRFIGLLLGLLEICITYKIFVLQKRLSGYTVLVEEAPVDIFVKRHRPRFRFLESIFLGVLPRADLSLLCKANADAIYKRKPELEVEEILNYYDRISALLAGNERFKFKILSTDIDIKSSNEILIKLLAEAWQ